MIRFLFYGQNNHDWIARKRIMKTDSEIPIWTDYFPLVLNSTEEALFFFKSFFIEK